MCLYFGTLCQYSWGRISCRFRVLIQNWRERLKRKRHKYQNSWKCVRSRLNHVCLFIWGVCSLASCSSAGEGRSFVQSLTIRGQSTFLLFTITDAVLLLIFCGDEVKCNEVWCLVLSLNTCWCWFGVTEGTMIWFSFLVLSLFDDMRRSFRWQGIKLRMMAYSLFL